jgi:formylglycine-generating enzyme required for sulfatase activity
LISFVFIVGIGQYGGFRWWDARKTERFWLPEACPAHEVVVATPFYMGKYEVTQEQYEKVMGENPSGIIGANLPVEHVSWNDAQEFCGKLSQKVGKTVRLPSEAEWEYACRAGSRMIFFCGDNEADLARVAWYYENSNETTHPVGQKEANAFGLHDMLGNVCEWCEDDWHENYKGAPITAKPWKNEATEIIATTRGGSYKDMCCVQKNGAPEIIATTRGGSYKSMCGVHMRGRLPRSYLGGLSRMRWTSEQGLRVVIDVHNP